VTDAVAEDGTLGGWPEAEALPVRHSEVGGNGGQVDEHREIGAALDGIEGALDGVAATMARMT